MKNLFSIIALVCIVTSSFSQVKRTDGFSGLPTTINMSDNSVPDFYPTLLHVDQQPVPSAEYGNKKEILHKLRAEKEASEDYPKEKKQRGLAPNPSIYKGFQGNFGGIPTDNDIAVSNAGIVMSVVNSNIRIFDDTGKILQSKSLTNFFGLPNLTPVSDPRVLYDPMEDRFVAFCFSGSVSTTSEILFAFSQTNDPTGVWNKYTLTGAPFNDTTWSDYPIISLSSGDLFLTINHVKDNVSWTIGFKESVIYQIDKQTGYTGVPLSYTLWSGIQHNGINNRNICPAKYQVPPFGNNMYFLTLRNVAFTNDSIFLTEITNTKASGNAQLVQRVLITPTAYGFPPNARQKAGSAGNNYLMTNDARVLAAIYENDYIHFGSNTVNPTFMNAAVYLGTIKNVSNATPTIQANIVSEAGMEYGYPSMTYIGQAPNDHKVLYTFSHCITDSFPGTSALYKDASDNWSDVIHTKFGTSVINILTDSNDRWGDYTNIQKMYNNPNRAYLAGSWGKSNGMNTWITAIDNTDFPVSVQDIKQSSKQDVVVYPNPSEQQRFSIRFSLDASMPLSFELYDMNGRKLNTLLKAEGKKGTNEFSFATEALAKGTYIVQILTNNQTLQSAKVHID